jgi:hypothetical protein
MKGRKDVEGGRYIKTIFTGTGMYSTCTFYDDVFTIDRIIYSIQ